MNVIKANYGVMREVARFFREKAAQVEAILRDLERRINQLDASWDGIAEQAFRQEWESCRRKLEDTPRMLHEIAEALFRIADELEQAELRMRNEIPNIIQSDNR